MPWQTEALTPERYSAAKSGRALLL